MTSITTRLRRLGATGLRVLSLPQWSVLRVREAVATRLDGSPAGAVWSSAQRARAVTSRLADRAPLSRDAGDQPVNEAVRWMGQVNIGGRHRDALFCHPPASIRFQLAAPAGARLRAHCGIMPTAWQRSSAVTFTMHVERARSRRAAHVSRILRPRHRRDHRLWRPLQVAIPAPADADDTLVTVRLSTASAEASNTAHAWAVFGDPRLESPLPVSHLRHAGRTFISRIRHEGIGRAIEQARQSRAVVDQQALFDEWVHHNTPNADCLAGYAREQDTFPWRPTFTIVTPVYNTEPRWLRACIESVRGQIYPHWQLSIADDASSSPETVSLLREYEADPRISIVRLEKNSHISMASNAALERATGDFVALLDHDDELTPDALFHVARFLNSEPAADLIYSDEDKLDLSGSRCDPYFKPDWSPDHFLTCMYTCHLMVVRRSLLEEVGGFRRGFEGAQDYDLVLRLMEKTRNIHHIPKILYHWRKLPESTASAGSSKPWALDAGRLALEDYVKRNDLQAEVLPGPAPGVFRIRRAIRGTPLVSIIIPTAGRLRREGSREFDLLAACIHSIRRLTSWPHYELIIVADAGGLQPTTITALEGCRHTIVTDANTPFNFSRKINLGVSRANGAHLLLLNDDVEATDPEWLSSMLELSQDPGVGAVGAKLLYPDGRLQHIGMVLGVGGVAAHVFHQHPGVSPGYASSALSIRNYSAVTAACLMLRRSVFTEVGGFDEGLPVDFNDVDFCLRVRQAGYRIVFTPYAQLFHHESASTGAREWRGEDVEVMRQRWGTLIDDDPHYNPNLTRETPDYRVPAGPLATSSTWRR